MTHGRQPICGLQLQSGLGVCVERHPDDADVRVVVEVPCGLDPEKAHRHMYSPAGALAWLKLLFKRWSSGRGYRFVHLDHPGSGWCGAELEMPEVGELANALQAMAEVASRLSDPVVAMPEVACA